MQMLAVKMMINAGVCLAVDVLPMLLCGDSQLTTHAQFSMWLEKAIEFYVCFASQSQHKESGTFSTIHAHKYDY